jgi:hypothetical protein
MKRTTYYGSRISDNLARTPEGFLICQNVPIARTGMQKYLGNEMGLEDNNIYEVEREPTDVFSPETIASFEGKPFTDEHPVGNEVSPENASWLVKGSVQNVHRGSGDEENMLLADIVVYDKSAIQAIEDGKREISCGYECVYEPLENGKYRQTGIVGNHVALVKKGRAGEKVAIKDEQPKEEGGKKMPSENRKTLWGRMIGLVRDHAPEDLEMAVDEMTAACANDEGDLTDPAPAPVAPKEERPKNPVEDNASGDTPEGNPLEARLDKLEQMLAQLLQAAAPKQEPDALDALEEELKGKVNDGEEGEENTPNNAETNDEEGSEVIEGKTAENENAAADSLALLKQMKPLVAGIKDPKQRKAASDTLAKLLRSQMGVSAQNQETGAYSILLNAKKQAHDSGKQFEDTRDLGRQWAAMNNPHYKKKEVK